MSFPALSRPLNQILAPATLARMRWGRRRAGSPLVAPAPATSAREIPQGVRVRLLSLNRRGRIPGRLSRLTLAEMVRRLHQLHAGDAQQVVEMMEGRQFKSWWIGILLTVKCVIVVMLMVVASMNSVGVSRRARTARSGLLRFLQRSGGLFGGTQGRRRPRELPSTRRSCCDGSRLLLMQGAISQRRSRQLRLPRAQALPWSLRRIGGPLAVATGLARLMITRRPLRTLPCRVCLTVPRHVRLRRRSTGSSFRCVPCRLTPAWPGRLG